MSVNASVKSKEDFGRVRKSHNAAKITTYKRAGAYIYRIARNSMKKRKGPSKPGQPPNTRGLYRNALVFIVQDESVVIGPRFSRVGRSFAAHEFGGKHYKTLLPKRPTMAPALRKAIPRLSSFMKGSMQ